MVKEISFKFEVKPGDEDYCLIVDRDNEIFNRLEAINPQMAMFYAQTGEVKPVDESHPLHKDISSIISYGGFVK